jgi:hypothetical protein
MTSAPSSDKETYEFQESNAARFDDDIHSATGRVADDDGEPISG